MFDITKRMKCQLQWTLSTEKRETLDVAWPRLDEKQKGHPEENLSSMRSISGHGKPIGSSGGQAFDERRITVFKDGPFESEAAFNAWHRELHRGTPPGIRP